MPAHELEHESDSDLSQHLTPRVGREATAAVLALRQISESHSASNAAGTSVAQRSPLSALAGSSSACCAEAMDTLGACSNAPLQDDQGLKSLPLPSLPSRRSSSVSAGTRSLSSVEETEGEEKEEDMLLDMLREQQEAQMCEVILRAEISAADAEDTHNLEEQSLFRLRIEQMEMQRLREALAQENHSSAAPPSERRARPTSAPANQSTSRDMPSVACDSCSERESSLEEAASAQGKGAGMLTAARHPKHKKPWTLLGKRNMVIPLLNGQGCMAEDG